MKITAKGPKGTKVVHVPPINVRLEQRARLKLEGSRDRSSPLQTTDPYTGNTRILQVPTQLVRDVVDANIGEKESLIRRVVSRTTDSVIDEFFKFVAKVYMTVNGINEARKDGAYWAPLSYEYLARKRREGRLIHHWAYRRTLRSAFSRRSGVQYLGRTVVDVRKPPGRGQSRQRREISVQYAPRALLAESLERSSSVVSFTYLDTLFFDIGAISESEYVKLRGHQETYRALLGPAFRRLVTKGLRPKITKALQNAGFRGKSIRDDGSFDGGGGASIPTGIGGAS